MRIAAVYLSHFFSDAEVRRRPSLFGVPLVIGDNNPPKHVLDCSRETGKRGVTPGMPIRQAVSRCPEAAVLAPDYGHYAELWDTILDALDRLTPEVEDTKLGLAYLNVAGLEGHYHDEQGLADAIHDAVIQAAGLTATVGIAANKAVASAAASSCATTQVIGRGGEASFLGPLPISTLPFSAEVIARLSLLGLEQVSQVATLPMPALAEQFGGQGQRLWELANGIDQEPLRPRKREEVLEEWISFDGSVTGIEVMVAAAGELLGRLVSRLDGRAARELLLRAELSRGGGWEHLIVLKEAVSEHDRLLFVVKTALREKPPPGAVLALGIRPVGLAGQTGRQLGLGEKRSTDAIRESVRQMEVRHGRSPISRFVEVEPWSRVPEDRCVLVEYSA